MKKVYQTRTGNKGNCFAACVASILELPLKQVPNRYLTEKQWVKIWQEFLRPFNLGMVWCEPLGSNQKPTGWVIGAFNVKGHPDTLHAVLCYNGRKRHDPFPKNQKHKELGKLEYWCAFTILDPLQPVKLPNDK